MHATVSALKKTVIITETSGKTVSIAVLNALIKKRITVHLNGSLFILLKNIDVS